MSTDFGEMFQIAVGYAHSPVALVATTAAVVCYASYKFSTPTDRLKGDESILPPRIPAVQTTYLRYRLSLGLYVLTWLLFFGGFAFFPDMLNSTLVVLGSLGLDVGHLIQNLHDLLEKNRDDLPTYLPLIAFAFMYVVGKAPGFSAVEQGLRDWLNDLAKIPLEARRMSSQLRDLAPAMSPAFLARIAADTWSKNLREFRRGLYDDWIRLRYLAHQVESWSAQPDYSRFDLKYAEERRSLLTAKAKLGDELRRLDTMLGAEPKVPAALLDDDAQHRAEELGLQIGDFTTFICYGVLASFTTQRARNEALECIGYPVVKPGMEIMPPRPDEEFPLDSAALTLVLVPIFVAIAASTWIFTMLPDAWFGDSASLLSRLGFPGCIRWAFWGTMMHFATVTAVLATRRALRGTAMRAWLERADPMERPYGLYLFGGLIGFVTGGAIALFASAVGPFGFNWFAIAWGSVTFVTGASVIWHIDGAKRATASRYANAGASLVHLLGAEPDWRIPVGQGSATAVISLFANLYVLGAREASDVDWKFCIYLVVSTAIVGAFLGQHLHQSFYRRETRKHAINDRTQSPPPPPPPAERSTSELVPSTG